MTPLVARRLEIARAFHGRDVEPIRLDHTRLRFSLGTSLADLKVPFHVEPEVIRIVSQASRQLVLLLVSRHKNLLPTDELDRFLLDEEFGALPQPSPLLSPNGGGPETRNVAELAPRAHPLLTGGVMLTWLSPGGGGRSLVALVIEVMRHAFSGWKPMSREETPSLVALMLSSLLPTADAAIRSVQLASPLDRWFRGAASCGVALSLHLGVDRAIREARPPQDVAMRIESVFSPAVLLGGRSSMYALGATLYGCELLAGVPAFDEVMAALNAGFPAAENALLEVLSRDAEAAKRAESAVAEQCIRESALEAAVAGEAMSGDKDGLLRFLHELLFRPAQIRSVLAEEKGRKQLAKDLAKAADERPDAMKVPLMRIASAFKGYKDKEPAASIGLERRRAHERYAHAAIASLADLWLERAMGRVRRLLEHRTGNESEGGLEQEYAEGRLYRISLGPHALLRTKATPNLGHLFVDVKDFTRRTALLGQAAMADFLRERFYFPVLASAKKHYGGMSHLSDRGGVTINNLLGDAVSLSGDIVALVEIAIDIRRHLRAYERELKRAVPPEQIEQAVAAIEEKFARLAREQPNVNPVQLATEKEAALARALGEGLEAGVFVSYGPAPLVIVIEDDVFGRSRVAIADRINESARGTARATSARAGADALLSLERARRQDPKLTHPWSVFIGSPLVVQIPAAAEHALRRAVEMQDGYATQVLLGDAIRQALEHFARADPSSGEIYNAGVALSEEALNAYREAIADRRVFKDVELRPERLHPEITRRYFFPPRVSLRLCVAFENGRVREIFRYVGKAAFKGLERGGGVPVWEVVDESGVGALLAQHHEAEWWRA